MTQSLLVGPQGDPCSSWAAGARADQLLLLLTPVLVLTLVLVLPSWVLQRGAVRHRGG